MPYPILVGRRTRITREMKVTMVPYVYIIDQKGILKVAKIFMQEDAITTVERIIEIKGKQKRYIKRLAEIKAEMEKKGKK